MSYSTLKWCPQCQKKVVPIEKLVWEKEGEALYVLQCPHFAHHVLGSIKRLTKFKEVGED